MFTVAFINSLNGHFEISNYFSSKKRAIQWAAWLRTQKFVSETTVYKGQAGGELIEKVGA